MPAETVNKINTRLVHISMIMIICNLLSGVILLIHAMVLKLLFVIQDMSKVWIADLSVLHHAVTLMSREERTANKDASELVVQLRQTPRARASSRLADRGNG